MERKKIKMLIMNTEKNEIQIFEQKAPVYLVVKNYEHPFPLGQVSLDRVVELTSWLKDIPLWDSEGDEFYFDRLVIDLGPRNETAKIMVLYKGKDSIG